MSRLITPEEVKKHADKRSSWIIIRNEVYDVTSFLHEHPGGADILLDYAGRDATTAFDEVNHSDNARQLMTKYKIGSISKHGPHCCVPHHNTNNLQSGFVPCPNKIIVLPVTSNECCTPDERRVPKKTWRSFDGGKAKVEVSTSIDGSRSVAASQSAGGPNVGPQSAGGPRGGPQSGGGPYSAGGPRSTGGSQSASGGPRSFGGPGQGTGSGRGHKSKDALTPAGGHPAHKSHGGALGFLKGPCQHCKQDPKQLRGPRPEDHVKSIIVPRESGKLKWALILLASALVVAIAVKKFKG